MAERQSTFGTMFTTLLVVTLASSAALGYVYELTKGPRAAALERRKIQAIQRVVPAFTNNPIAEGRVVNADGGAVVLYPARDAGKFVGAAVETFSKKGFGPIITLMVGFLADGSINGIEVISHQESPGLGDKMETGKSQFSKQFTGKNPAQFRLRVTKDGGNVDAITAATISSRGYCDAVERAYTVFMKEYHHESVE